MDHAFDRRRFLAGSLSLPLSLSMASCGSRSLETRDELADPVAELHASLSPDQRRLLCLDGKHPKRAYTNNNWTILDQEVGQVLRPSQMELATRIFRGLHAEDFADEVLRQTQEDNGGVGIAGVSFAFFGTPQDAEGLTLLFAGRHLTRRWQQNSREPFGGSMMAGHASGDFYEKPDHAGNIWWYQSLAANRLYKSLPLIQQAAALTQSESRDKPAVLLGPQDTRGLSFAELNGEGRELAKLLLEAVLTRPYRRRDSQLAWQAIEARGGIDSLKIHYFQKEDLGRDGVWDNWEIWGPGFVCFFRGNPHPHCWIKVAPLA
ncbi:MAG: hypothetical protein RL095_394 [Verrucomicrobiota bacterium]|jgi:hypothetical protein